MTGGLPRGMMAFRPVNTMISVGRVNDIFGRCADGARRIATVPHASVVAHALLGLLAVAESIVHAASSPPADYTGGTAFYSLVLSLVALATTLPLALFWPQ